MKIFIIVTKTTAKAPEAHKNRYDYYLSGQQFLDHHVLII